MKVAKAAKKMEMVLCCVCGRSYLRRASAGERWSWGPKGMHVHFYSEHPLSKRVMEIAR
jgi:hypothetical protein